VARIALVCEPPDGGVAEHVLQLAQGLEAHGHEAVVFGPLAFAPAERLRRAGRGFRALDLRRDYAHPHRDAAAFMELVRAVRRGAFDLVHGHAAKAGVLGRLAARATRRPAVYTPHCFPFVGDISDARRRFGSVVERTLAPLTAAIVCVSEDERRTALRHGIGPPERLVVVHNGCPPDDPAVAPDPGLAELRGDGLLVAAITVLRRQKSVEVLLDAAPRILAEVPDARVAVVGEGPEESSLRAHAAELGLDADPRFAFLPFAPPTGRYLHALDVFVLPSAWEAFSIGVLEAQASGVPQVATDVGGTGEAVVPATGVLVPPRDPGRLAAVVVELLRDPARRKEMAAASRERHARLFTVERMVARTAALYDRVLAARR